MFTRGFLIRLLTVGTLSSVIAACGGSGAADVITRNNNDAVSEAQADMAKGLGARSKQKSSTSTTTTLSSTTTTSTTASSTTTTTTTASTTTTTIATTSSFYNVGLLKPAISSAIEGADYDASYAVDGNLSTRWSSAFSDPQWIYVDLGAGYPINHAVLKWETAYSAQYTIDVSNDTVNWVTVFTQLNGTGGTETITLPANSTGRFVRLNSTRRATAWGNSLWEFELYTSAQTGTVVTTTTTTQPTTTTTTTRSTSTTTSTTVSSTTTTTQQTAGDDPVNWGQLLANAKGVVRYVSSATEFSSASAAARPGDVIVVRNGTYTGWPTQYITTNGTSSAPIVYMAETPGQVIFQDQSWVFWVTGNWNIIGGFTFQRINYGPIRLDGPTGPNTVGASDNRITNVTLIECGKDGGWWMLQINHRAHRNRIDHSLFERSYGNIRVAVDEADAVAYGPSQDLRVDHNVFQNAIGIQNPVLQLGQGEDSQKGSSLLAVRAIFEYNTIQNWFTNYNEIVSSKTSNNIIRYNTFKNAYGGIVLRYGNYAQVYGNYISGTGGGNGITISGAFHQIYNNIIDAPEKKHALYLSRWGARNNDNPLPDTHDVLVAHNTFLSYQQYGLRIGDCDNGACNQLSKITIANNVIKGTQGLIFYYASGTVTNFTVRNNLYFNAGSAAYGGGYDYDAAPITGNPMIANPTALPAGSLAVNMGWPVAGIGLDYYRNARIVGGAPDIGAIEYKP